MNQIKNNPLTLKLLRNPIHLLSFGFGTGYMPVAPGTFGTLIGIPFFLVLSQFSVLNYAVIVVAMFLIGVWFCSVTSRALGVHDHKAIVWDEVVGYLITMFMVPPTALTICAGFALFRLFDIWKPWPINWLDKYVHGGLGIMLDDVLAGIFALVVLQFMLKWIS